MQTVLKIAVGGLAEEVEKKCPFKYEDRGVSEIDSEYISDDDRDELQSDQANNGAILGKNLIAKLPDKSLTINSHIGYNVNVCHNGVWLPGNYAIRKSSSSTGESWGDMSEANWQMNYVAAASKAAGGQFHDTHSKYNEAVKRILNKISAVLLVHQDVCEDCKNKTEVPPPYQIKQRLYNLSEYFKTQLTGPPGVWRRPWFTSDRLRDAAFFGGKLKPEFTESYTNTEVE